MVIKISQRGYVREKMYRLKIRKCNLTISFLGSPINLTYNQIIYLTIKVYLFRMANDTTIRDWDLVQQNLCEKLIS